MITRRVRAIPGLRSSHGRSVHRLALSPACWGINGAHDWGPQLSSERVLAEAAAVGEGAISAGPSGFLPDRSDDARRVLRRHGLTVVAGQVHAILHHHDTRGPELAHIDGHANWLSVLGADTLVLSAIRRRTPDLPAGEPLSRAEWAHLLHLVGSVEHVCAKHRLKLAVQPRFGSSIQGPEDIERLLVGTEAGICLDVGHLVLAGADPIEVLELAAGRIQHVHLNDVDTMVARRVRSRSLDYDDAISEGLYRPLGEGGANVSRVVEALRSSRYRGWFTLEQDTRLASADDRPLGAISRSVEFLLPLLA
ncbi:MAG TPA: sugar phosphate isomerase/epimerase [Candidatus Dormibacteraeota bacterium]|nr:sugar phosphate isomerase/epimerase [Candidatus Dormibacteraeota bacterium]